MSVLTTYSEVAFRMSSGVNSSMDFAYTGLYFLLLMLFLICAISFPDNGTGDCDNKPVIKLSINALLLSALLLLNACIRWSDIFGMDYNMP